MYSSARVFWTIYRKDRTEYGSSEYFSNSKDLVDCLNTLCVYCKLNSCHSNIDVTFYPPCILSETLTIMGAI